MLSYQFFVISESIFSSQRCLFRRALFQDVQLVGVDVELGLFDAVGEPLLDRRNCGGVQLNARLKSFAGKGILGAG
jgi:hypothetical protein